MSPEPCPRRRVLPAGLGALLLGAALAVAALASAAQTSAPSEAPRPGQGTTGIAAAAPAAVTTTAPTGGADPLPASLFYAHADLAAVRLAPDGRRLAATLALGGRRVLAVQDLDGGPPRTVARFSDADVGRFDWVNGERLVFNLVDLNAGSGGQGWGPGLFTVLADGSGLRQVVRTRRDLVTGVAGPGREPLDALHTMLAVPADGGDEVVLGRLVPGIDGALREVVPLRLNLVTLRTRSLGLGMPEHATGWLFDRQGEPRVAVAVMGGERLVHWRGPPGAPLPAAAGEQRADWRLLARMPATPAGLVARGGGPAGWPVRHRARRRGWQRGAQALRLCGGPAGRRRPGAHARLRLCRQPGAGRSRGAAGACMPRPMATPRCGSTPACARCRPRWTGACPAASTC